MLQVSHYTTLGLLLLPRDDLLAGPTTPLPVGLRNCDGDFDPNIYIYKQGIFVTSLISQVRIALHNAETKQVQNSSISRELQTYLKTTYRKEREQYNIKKSAADKQLEEAKQWVSSKFLV